MGWLRRDGAIWSPLSSELVLGLVSEQVAQIGVEYIQSQGAKLMKDAPMVLSTNKAANVLRLMAGMLEEPDERFDSKPYKVNCLNGVVDVRTKGFREHRDDDRFLKVTGAEYDPDAVSGRWLQALEAIDPVTLDWLRLRFGQAVTGTRPLDDRVLFFKGGGSNGKSVLVDAITMALGSYAAAVPPKILLGSPSDHSTEMMTLQGVRLALLEEMPEHHLPGAMLKRLVGPREITARRIAKDNVTFPVIFTLFVTTNYPLRIADTDDGTWRRVTMVPFPYKYAKEPMGALERRKDPKLKRWSERTPDPAVLAWLVNASYDWYHDQPRFEQLPESVEAATNETRSENDLLSVFAEERLVLDQGVLTPKAEVFNAYLRWANEQNQKPLSNVAFVPRFKETDMGRHVSEHRTASAKYWVGVRLRERSPYIVEGMES
jgi:P4 family phage/plasmid primase-like protien